MNEREEKRNQVINFVENNNLLELKKYVQKHHVKLVDLNNKRENKDFLIDCIKKDVPLHIIVYIINKWYPDLNYYINIDEDEEYDYDDFDYDISPLSVALERNNFKIADYLMNHGASINELPKGTILNLINENNSNYLLNHTSLKVDEEIINELMDTKPFFVSRFFKYFYIYNNDFILNLLLIYKNHTKLNHSQLENIITSDKSKFSIIESFYREVIRHLFRNEFLNPDHNNRNPQKLNSLKKDYDLVKVLFANDYKNNDREKWFYLYKEIQRSHYKNSLKNELLHSIERHEIHDTLDDFDHSLVDILKKSIKNCEMEESIINWINQKDLPSLKNYIEMENIHLVNRIDEEFNNEGLYSYRILEESFANFNEDTINYLYHSGIDINLSDGSSKPLLFRFLDDNNFNPIKYLIPLGINLNIKYRIETPLKWAIKKNNMDLLKYFVEQGHADINFDAPLNYAIDQNKPDIINYFVEKGVDLNIHDSLHQAITTSNKSLIEYFIEKGADINKKSKNGDTPLGVSIAYGDMDIIKFLIEHGANINEGSYRHVSSLYLAISSDNTDLVDYLIQHGADINNTNSFSGDNENNKITLHDNQWRNSSLANAASRNYEDMINYLIEHGAEIRQDTMISAVHGRNIELVKYLLDHGGDINKKALYMDHQMVDPLWVAIARDDSSMVEFLIQHGATVNMNDDPEESSHLIKAILVGSDSIVKLLIDWVIKNNPQNSRKYNFIGKAYDYNEIYNLSEPFEDIYSNIKNHLDHYVQYFEFGLMDYEFCPNIHDLMKSTNLRNDNSSNNLSCRE